MGKGSTEIVLYYGKGFLILRDQYLKGFICERIALI